MNRRHFIKTTGAAAASLVLNPLPAFATPGSHRITASTGKALLLGKGNPDTAVWCYNNTVPGPVLRLKQGQPASIHFTNRLPQPTTLHWHGLRIPNAMDGVPGLTQPLIKPNASFEYAFTPPDAGTFWYHPHNKTWEQLARGLYGIVIVEETNPPKVDQDRLLVIDDWLINQEGQIDEQGLGALHDWAHGGRQGNWLTVNGKPRETIQVTHGERLRLRLVNVANSRIMPMHFQGIHPKIVAIDGQPIAPTTVRDNTLAIAPGQRFDLVVDMEQDPGSKATLSFVTRDGLFDLAHFVYDKKLIKRKQALDSPIALPPNPLPANLDLAQAKKVELLMQGGAMGGLRSASYQGKHLDMRELMQNKMVWALNGVADLPKTPLVRVKRGQTVVIDMKNDNRWPHAMHLHGHHFKILSNDSPGSAWRDTTLINGGDTQRLAFVADNPGKWLLHCHMVEHTAAGMVTWLEVV